MGQATAVLTQYMPLVSRGPAWQVGVSSTYFIIVIMHSHYFALYLDWIVCYACAVSFRTSPTLMFTPGLLCCRFGRSGVSGQLSMFLLIDNGFISGTWARLASVSYCAYLFLFCCMIC